MEKKITFLVLLWFILALLLLAGCKPGNQVTGSSAFVDNPQELLPSAEQGNISRPAHPLAPNWITGSLG